MSKLYVDTIYPNSGELVELSGNLHVSGTLNAYEFKTIVHDSTTYRGDTSFGNSVDDVSTFSSQVTASYGATIASGKKLKIGADQEYLKGDGTDIHFGLGSGGDINIPASIGLTFGDDGEKIEGDGTNLAIASSAELDLTAGSTVDINATTTVTVDGTGISIDGTDDSNFTVAGSNKDLTISVSGGSTQTLTVSSAGTGTNAIDINATAGGVDVDANGAISLDSAAGSIDINVVDGQTVNVGLNGAVETIWSPHGTAGSELWSTINTAGTTDGTDAAGAILLSTVAGGIGLAWADTKDLWAEGGQFVVTANHDTAGAIKLHADAGTSQTILIQNDAGTGAGAVNIAADAGGIALDAGLDIVLDADGGDIFFKAGGATSGSLNFNTANKFTLSSSSPSNDFYLMSGRDMVLDADGGQVHIKDADASHFLLDCDNTKFVIYDDQDTGDLFSITVAQHGATTITTVDDDATAADLTFTIDGDIIFNPAGGDILPNADGTTNLGSSSKRWANVYTGDLHLKNNKGDWTILEEENYLCVVNNKTQKRYKMMLEEIGE